MIRGFFCFKKAVSKTAAVLICCIAFIYSVHRCNPMNLLIDDEAAKSLEEAERDTGKSKEELLKLCLRSHLLKELGSSGLSAFLRSNNFVEVLPDTAFD